MVGLRLVFPMTAYARSAIFPLFSGSSTDALSYKANMSAETSVTVRDRTPDLSFDKVASCGEKATDASVDKLDLRSLLDRWQKRDSKLPQRVLKPIKSDTYNNNQLENSQ
jgi:hypothetical protein